jgi:hypothetical protein
VLFGAENHLQHSLLDWKAVGRNLLLKINVKVSILQLNVILLDIISASSDLLVMICIDPLHICSLIIGMLFVVIGFSTYSPNTGCGKLASFFLQTAQFKKGS